MKPCLASTHAGAKSGGPAGLVLGFLIAGVLFCCCRADGVQLTGVNGKVVDFAGVRRASPEGLEVQVAAGGGIVTVPWSRFDLQRMAAEAPQVFAAYEKAKAGQVVDLGLGTFASQEEVPKAVAMEVRPLPETAPSYSAEAEVSGIGGESGVLRIRAVAILPPSGDTKAVLILLKGDSGDFVRSGPILSGGLWLNLMAKMPVALVMCNVATDHRGSLRGTDPAFVHAERGSGDLLFNVVHKLGQQLKRENWDKIPVMVYGHGVTGAAWAFNLAQWKPERVIGAVAAKGAFYATPVTDESLQVPLMFIKGLNDSGAQDWKATHLLEETYAAHIARMPNWIFAVDPNGDHNENPVSYRMAQEFMLEAWKMRQPDETGAIPLPSRVQGWVGSLETGDILRPKDPAVALGANQTWLPSAAFAKIWKDFASGVLLPGEPGLPASP